MKSDYWWDISEQEPTPARLAELAESEQAKARLLAKDPKAMEMLPEELEKIAKRVHNGPYGKFNKYLTEEQYIEIQELSATMTNKQLAAKYQCSPTTISKIKNGHTKPRLDMQ
jgi:hypothetical protein